MRYRKKLTKWLSVSLGKKKSSVTVGGFNIPIKGNSGQSDTSNEGCNRGCSNAFVIAAAAFGFICVFIAIFSDSKKSQEVIKGDSSSVDSVHEKLHHKRKHKLKSHRTHHLDTILIDSPHIDSLNK